MALNLASKSQLETFFNPSDCLSDQIATLERLLRVLEFSLLLSCHIFALPHDTHRLMLERAFQMISIKGDWCMRVHLQRYSNLVTKLVHSVTQSYDFKSWKLKLQSREKLQLWVLTTGQVAQVDLTL